MAKRVVDGSEPVEVDLKKRHAARRALREFDRALGALHDLHAVRQIGQRIEVRHVGDFLIRDKALRLSTSVTMPLDLKGGASISLEIDPAELRTNELRNVNRMVGDKLRETPLIPVRERTPQGDAVIVRVTKAEDTQRAIDRLKTLGGPTIYTIGSARRWRDRDPVHGSALHPAAVRRRRRLSRGRSAPCG